MDRDDELLERIRKGGDILASDLHNCVVKCFDCGKNGCCKYQLVENKCDEELLERIRTGGTIMKSDFEGYHEGLIVVVP